MLEQVAAGNIHGDVFAQPCGALMALYEDDSVRFSPDPWYRETGATFRGLRVVVCEKASYHLTVVVQRSMRYLIWRGACLSLVGVANVPLVEYTLSVHFSRLPRHVASGKTFRRG